MDREKEDGRKYKTLLIPYTSPGPVQPTLSREYRDLVVRLCSQHLKDQVKLGEKLLRNRSEQAGGTSLSAEIGGLRAELRMELDALKLQMQESGSPLAVSRKSPEAVDDVKVNLLQSADEAFGEGGRNNDVSKCFANEAHASPRKSEDKMCEAQLEAKRVKSSKSKMWDEQAKDTSDQELKLTEIKPVQQEVTDCKGVWIRVRSFLTSGEFEMIMGVLILLNVLSMALQFQYDGIQGGYALSLQAEEGIDKLRLTRDYPRAADREWPGGEVALQVIDLTFSIFFIVDVALRIIFCGLQFWRSPLNITDFFVVLIGALAIVLQDMDINPSFMRMLRLVKLGRGVTAIKNSPAVQSLQLLMKCLAHSVQTLCWSLCVILVIQCIAAMVIGNALKPFMDDTAQDVATRAAIFRYYGTFTKSMLTMFEVLLANWIPACRILTDNVSEWFSLLFILYRCLVGFAVLNVVNAVFIQSTMKVAQQDREIVIAQKERQNEFTKRSLTALFAEMDSSGDGRLSLDELEQVMGDPTMKTWMAALDIDTDDLKQLFHLLDDGDGEVSAEEFMGGIGRLKGQAKAIDMATLLVQIGRIEARLDSWEDNMKRFQLLPHPPPAGGSPMQPLPMQSCPTSSVSHLQLQPQSNISTPGQIVP